MTLGHALLALGLTAVALIALQYEERDLVRSFGAAYDRWRKRRLEDLRRLCALCRRLHR